MRGLVGCRLGRVVVAGVEEEDCDAGAAVVDPDVGLVTAPAVGLVGAAAERAAAPEVLALHLRELLPGEQLAAHEGGEEGGGVLGVGDDAAFGADAPMPVGRLELHAVRLNSVALGVGAAHWALRVVGGRVEAERPEDPLPV